MFDLAFKEELNELLVVELINYVAFMLNAKIGSSKILNQPLVPLII